MTLLSFSMFFLSFRCAFVSCRLDHESNEIEERRVRREMNVSWLEGEQWEVLRMGKRKREKKERDKYLIFFNNINFSRSTFSSFQTRYKKPLNAQRAHKHSSDSFFSTQTLCGCSCSSLPSSSRSLSCDAAQEFYFLLLLLLLFLFALDRCTSFVIRSTFSQPARSVERQTTTSDGSDINHTDYQKV